MAVARRSFNSNAIVTPPVSPFNYPIAQPAGMADGDVVLLTLCANGSAGTVTPPSGFVLTASNTTQNPRVYEFIKVITSAVGEPATWNIVGTAGVAASTTSEALTGVDLATPQDVASQATANLAATSAALNGLTTRTDGAFIRALIGINSSSSVITETSALVAEVVEVGGKVSEIDDGTQSLSGPTGTITFNISTSLASTGIVTAIRAAGAPLAIRETQPRPLLPRLQRFHALTGFAPLPAFPIPPTAAAAAGNVVVTPDVGVLTLTGIAPTVLTPVVVTPDIGSLVLTGLAPTVLTPVVVTPGAAALVLTGIAPTVLTPVVVTPGLAALVLTGIAPTVLTPVVVSPAVAALVLTGIAPTVTVSAGVVVTPAVGALVLTGIAPTVSVSSGVVVIPGRALLILTGRAPTVRVGRRRHAWLEAAANAPVVAEALMENLVAEYGENRGKHVYFAMEREQKGPFAAGNKYDATERPPQPVVVVQSDRPGRFFGPPPAVNAPKAADATLRDFIKDATERTGVKKPPTVL
jgi:hypothetical protein